MTSIATPPTPREAAARSAGTTSSGLRALLKSLLSHQIVRFGLIGMMNTAFAYGLFVALQLTLGRVTHYLGVLLVATVVAIVQAYILQRWLVFRSTYSWWQGLVRFSLVYFGAFLFNLAALPLLVEVVRLPVIPAQGIALVIQAVGTYTAHRLFTFRQPSNDSIADGSRSGDGTTDTAPAASSSPGDA